MGCYASSASLSNGRIHPITRQFFDENHARRNLIALDCSVNSPDGVRVAEAEFDTFKVHGDALFLNQEKFIVISGASSKGKEGVTSAVTETQTSEVFRSLMESLHIGMET